MRRSRRARQQLHVGHVVDLDYFARRIGRSSADGRRARFLSPPRPPLRPSDRSAASARNPASARTSSILWASSAAAPRPWRSGDRAQAERDGGAMRERVPALDLERVPERVAEVQLPALAVLPWVAVDDVQLDRAARSVIAYAAAGSHRRALRPRGTRPPKAPHRRSTQPLDIRQFRHVAGRRGVSTADRRRPESATPAKRLPRRSSRVGRSIATLPPNAESAWASHVVGRLTRGMPRRCSAAARPARSPSVPPPATTSGSSRSTFIWREPRRAAAETRHRLRLFARLEVATPLVGRATPSRCSPRPPRGRRRTPGRPAAAEATAAASASR